MADLSDLAAQIAYLESGGRPQGKPDTLDTFNKAFQTTASVGTTYQDIIKNALANKKAQLELETGSKLTQPIKLMVGQEPVPNVTAGADMSGQAVTSMPKRPALPEGMEKYGDLNLLQIDKIADAQYKLNGGATGRTRTADAQDVLNSGGYLQEGQEYTLSQIAQAAAMGRAIALQANAKSLALGGEELLTPDEAQKLDVPYGTKRKQAVGKIPQKIPTDTQQVTNTYANRLQESGLKIDELTDYAKSANPVWFKMQKNTPDWANAIKNDSFRQLEQAMRNFINATLRRESGATIQPHEFEEGIKQYFPIPGDDEGTVALKKQNRDTVSRGFIQGAGGAYTPPPKQETAEPPGAAKAEIMRRGGQPTAFKNGQSWKYEGGKFVRVK